MISGGLIRITHLRTVKLIDTGAQSPAFSGLYTEFALPDNLPDYGPSTQKVRLKQILLEFHTA